MDGVQVVARLHVALVLVQTGCVVQGKLNVVESDEVLVRLERTGLCTAGSDGTVLACDKIDEGALSYTGVADDEDVAAAGLLRRDGAFTDPTIMGLCALGTES